MTPKPMCGDADARILTCTDALPSQVPEAVYRQSLAALTALESCSACAAGQRGARRLDTV